MIKKTCIILTAIAALIYLDPRMDLQATIEYLFNKKETKVIYTPEQAFEILKNENDWCSSYYFCFTIRNRYFFT